MASIADQTTDVLRRRLASAEKDTQQLMQQLEEMGFSTKSKNSANNPRVPPKCHEDESSELTDEITLLKKEAVLEPTNGNFSPDFHQVITQVAQNSNVKSNVNKEKVESAGESKSSKHKPITPFSLRGLSASRPLDCSSGKDVTEFAPKSLRSVEGSSRRKPKSVVIEDEGRIGRHELEQELLRVKRLAVRLEEEAAFEMEAKDRAREEVEKLKLLLDGYVKSEAEQQMKVEELTTSKQKLSRSLLELKEEVSRESSLRASLEESHKTLLSRLQDMESVIETLRSEGKNQTTCSNTMKVQLVKLQDELEQETCRRRKIEEVHVITVAEKDRLKINLTSSQVENQRASQDLGRLQGQYTELISQLGEAQKVSDHLKTSKTTLEEERQQLHDKVKSLTLELEELTSTQQETKESESRLSAEKSSLEEDYYRLKAEKEKAVKTMEDNKKKIDNLEKELKSSNNNLSTKNEEFSKAANCLETELSTLRNQLEAMECEKLNVLKDKESLLEEVNQTVDTLMAERSKLQTELQASLLEGESLRIMCSKLENNKAEMLERLGSYQHHQNTQQKVETALKQMMEAKNKLAYDNGKLQSTISQLQTELDNVSRDQGDITQMKKLCQSLQAKYTQSQQEISEYKISLQRAETQARTAVDEMQSKDRDLKLAVSQRDEMDRQLEKVSGKLEVLEDRDVSKVHNYKKSMEESKLVNQEMANTLEAVMASHTQLQQIVENLQVELGKRDSQISQLKASRNKDMDGLRSQLLDYESKIETTRSELKREKDSVCKKSAREVSEIKKQNDSLSVRNQELVKLNTELRHRLSEGEKEKTEMKSKMSGQKHKMEYLHRAKKELEDNLSKMKTVKAEITELEQMRDEYMRKNKDQAESISKFVSQISSLQDEVKQLAQAHISSQELLKLKEEALEKERRIGKQMRKKYSEGRKREPESLKEAQGTNEKLYEVHTESLEISKHLQEAHDWFKGKFDKLQTELNASKETQVNLAQNNQEQRKRLENERSKAEDAAERAKEMIKSSRQTISKLASYAEIAEADTKNQLAKLRAGLQAGTNGGKLSLSDLEV